MWYPNTSHVCWNMSEFRILSQSSGLLGQEMVLVKQSPNAEGRPMKSAITENAFPYTERYHVAIVL
jgi:hypothetical protein